MGLIFEVAEGGFLDIDVKIVGPDAKTIHEGSRSAAIQNRLVWISLNYQSLKHTKNMICAMFFFIM